MRFIENKKLLTCIFIAVLLFIGTAIWYIADVIENWGTTTDDKTLPLREFGIIAGLIAAFIIIYKERTKKRIIIGSIVGTVLLAVCWILSNNDRISFYFQIVLAVVLALVMTAILVYFFLSMKNGLKKEGKSHNGNNDEQSQENN